MEGDTIPPRIINVHDERTERRDDRERERESESERARERDLIRERDKLPVS